MAFAVEEFRDLLQLLREHPEWKAELRRELLGEELLQLPELVRQNTAAIAELRESVRELGVAVAELRVSVDGLRDAQAATEARLSDFIEATNRRFDRLEGDIGELKSDMTGVKDRLGHLEGSVEVLKVDVKELKRDVGDLKGDSLERWFREHAHLLVRGLRRPRVVDYSDLDDLVAAAALSPAEEDALLHVDLIVRGRVPQDGTAERYFAVEISSVIDVYDVARASERAAILQKLGLDARGLVAGKSILPDAEAAAREREIGVVLREG